MTKHRRMPSGREPVAPVGPALWVEERRPFDSPYFGPSPTVHGIADADVGPNGMTGDRRWRHRRRGARATLGAWARAVWSAVRVPGAPPRRP